MKNISLTISGLVSSLLLSVGLVRAAEHSAPQMEVVRACGADSLAADPCASICSF